MKVGDRVKLEDEETGTVRCTSIGWTTTIYCVELDIKEGSRIWVRKSSSTSSESGFLSLPKAEVLDNREVVLFT